MENYNESPRGRLNGVGLGKLWYVFAENFECFAILNRCIIDNENECNNVLQFYAGVL